MTGARGEQECLCCHRVERVTDAGREVVSEGGLRRPVGAPERAAWETVAQGLRGLVPPVVGTCAGCHQPMVGDGPPVAWTIAVPGGSLVLHADGALAGPFGPLTVAEADRLVAVTYAEPSPGLADRFAGLFRLGLFGLLIVPAAMALFMFVFVFWYLLNIGAGP